MADVFSLTRAFFTLCRIFGFAPYVIKISLNRKRLVISRQRFVISSLIQIVFLIFNFRLFGDCLKRQIVVTHLFTIIAYKCFCIADVTNIITNVIFEKLQCPNVVAVWNELHTIEKHLNRIGLKLDHRKICKEVTLRSIPSIIVVIISIIRSKNYNYMFFVYLYAKFVGFFTITHFCICFITITRFLSLINTRIRNSQDMDERVLKILFKGIIRLRWCIETANRAFSGQLLVQLTEAFIYFVLISFNFVSFLTKGAPYNWRVFGIAFAFSSLIAANAVINVVVARNCIIEVRFYRPFVNYWINITCVYS